MNKTNLLDLVTESIRVRREYAAAYRALHEAGEREIACREDCRIAEVALLAAIEEEAKK